MKHLVILLSLFCITSVFAQEYPKNEVKLNIANTIAIASVEVGYERFFDYSQSVEFELLINDRFNFYAEDDGKSFSTTSTKLGYNFYFGTENPGSGLYVNPFVKYRFGDFEETKTVEIDGAEVEQKQVTDMSGFTIALGGGYKWNISNSFVFGPYASIGRNFSDEVSDRFQAIEFYGGVSVGYRF